MTDFLACPVADCGEELYGDSDLRGHLQDGQACGCYGATPADHPLCDDCEKRIRG